MIIIDSPVFSAVGDTVHTKMKDVFLGEQVEVIDSLSGNTFKGEVVKFDGESVVVKLIEKGQISNGSKVRKTGQPYSVPINPNIVGKVIDCYGNTLYGDEYKYSKSDYISAEGLLFPLSTRSSISEILPTGVKVVDFMTPLGVGQRMGVFASAGGGKTTLMSVIANNTDADIVVFAMIGERAREVVEFLEGDISGDVLKKSITLVSTSDANPLEKVRTGDAAIAIAHHYRNMGKNVLLLFDSLTRFCRAKALVDETPITTGVPLGVSNAAASLVEIVGNAKQGSITGVFTILIEGNIDDDPIAHEVKSLLDGHIILSGAIAASGRYPAVDFLRSKSRVEDKIVSNDMLKTANKLRDWEKRFQDVELLVRVGEYVEGNDLETDLAIAKRTEYIEWLKQDKDDNFSYEELTKEVRSIISG